MPNAHPATLREPARPERRNTVMRYSILSLTLAALALTAAAQDTVRKSVPAQGAQRLQLRAEIGEIKAVGSSGNTVDVEVFFRGNAPSKTEFERMKRDFVLDVTQSAGTVRVESRFVGAWVRPSGWWIFGGWNNCHWMRNGRCMEYKWLRGLEIRVTIPQRMEVDLNTEGGSIMGENLGGRLLARTSGGSLEFTRVTGDIDARTSGGSITLREVGGRALLRTSGGSLNFDGVTGDVDAETSGGSISARRGKGKLRVHTSGGGIRIEDATGSVDASTSGGGIDVRLAADKGFDIDARTSGGGVSTDFAVPRRPGEDRNVLRTAVNGGGPLVILRTSGGGINIHTR